MTKTIRKWGLKMFVTFDGPNGVGKTTIIEVVAQKLRDLGFSVFLTKEPTSSSLGGFVKVSEYFMGGDAFACLIAADRYFHVSNEIKPQLMNYDVVISDRYLASSLVLQVLDGCDVNFIWNLHAHILIPTLSFILFADPVIIQRRMLSRELKLSRFEKEHSRLEEVDMYMKAAYYLKDRGFNIELIDNSDGLLESSAMRIVNCIADKINKTGGS